MHCRCLRSAVPVRLAGPAHERGKLTVTADSRAKFFVGGNWKANGTRDSIEKLCRVSVCSPRAQDTLIRLGLSCCAHRGLSSPIAAGDDVLLLVRHEGQAVRQLPARLGPGPSSFSTALMHSIAIQLAPSPSSRMLLEHPSVAQLTSDDHFACLSTGTGAGDLNLRPQRSGCGGGPYICAFGQGEAVARHWHALCRGISKPLDQGPRSIHRRNAS